MTFGSKFVFLTPNCLQYRPIFIFPGKRSKTSSENENKHSNRSAELHLVYDSCEYHKMVAKDYEILNQKRNWGGKRREGEWRKQEEMKGEGRGGKRRKEEGREGEETGGRRRGETLPFHSLSSPSHPFSPLPFPPLSFPPLSSPSLTSLPSLPSSLLPHTPLTTAQ